tara:strand:- start:7345 stop:8814 length:1470 start_codon:yes stop_codon:yes gene_type:complete
MTARGTRVEGLEKVFFFGLQAFIQKHLIGDWNKEFFEKPLEDVIKPYKRRLDNYLGPNEIGTKHIEDLHKLGYLPLEIYALPEGSNVNLRVPMFVMWNTHPEFFWLTNAIETIISTSLWGPCTSTTTAVMYRQLLEKWAKKTDPEQLGFVPFQGHDFSFRGHFGYEAAVMSGASHLLAFAGTDTVPAIDYLEDFYGADSDKDLVGASVSATEHSVMCMGGVDNEVETFRRLIEDIYPNGIISIVSDTWDFWEVVNPANGILVGLKDKVMARDGKVVIRPDSGDPIKIVCGYTDEEIDTHNKQVPESDRINPTELERKGMIECLWEIFGGTKNDQGYKVLDSHIGAIYGDSITLERADQICLQLEAKGFASTNIVFGIGSFTYQGAISPNAIITRDTHCFAVKSTYGEVLVDGEVKGIEIFKDPKTDDGLKKSAKGLIAVYEDGSGGFIMKDQATWDDVRDCAFRKVFSNGDLHNFTTLSEVRARVAKHF